jgi:aspartyl protease family protein
MTPACRSRGTLVTVRPGFAGWLGEQRRVIVRRMKSFLVTLAMAGVVGAAAAQTVTLNGHLGNHKALLVIDGELHTVAIGATVRGVRLLALNEAQAEVEVAGARRTLALRAGAVRNAGTPASGGNEIVLTAGRNGHFRTLGQINGKSVEFFVDTGASVVSLGQAEADRLGIDYKSGNPGMARTANGDVPIRMITLNSVRIGDVEVANVEAAVHPSSFGVVLLGNSFLTRFQMRRENDVMRLERR